MLREAENAAAAAAKGKSYSLCDLALLRLVLDGARDDVIATEHLRAAVAAVPYFRDFVRREAAWLLLASNAASAALMDAKESPEDGEFACSVCSRSLANVVLIEKTAKDARYYCGDCVPNKRWRGLVPLLHHRRAGAATGCTTLKTVRWRRQKRFDFEGRDRLALLDSGVFLSILIDTTNTKRHFIVCIDHTLKTSPNLLCLRCVFVATTIPAL